MLEFLAKLVRFMASALSVLANWVRCRYIEAKYPGSDLTNSRLGRSVSIICTDGSKLKLINCDVGEGSLIVSDCAGTIEIADCYIGRNCVIVARDRIMIGKHSQIAEMVVIRDQNHRYSHPSLPLSEQGFDVAPISIGENVWLGAKSTVLAGSKIGDSAVIGAHALVLGEIPARTLAIGTPASVKKFICETK